MLAFGRAFRVEVNKKLRKNQVFELVREMYIPGFGIADMVAVRQNRNDTFLYAFEMKLKGWRKALSQAYRYKYYSDLVSVVLPFNEAEKASQYLKLFQILNIGLIAFDASRKIIHTFYEPKQELPLSKVANEKARALFIENFKSLLSV